MGGNRAKVHLLPHNLQQGTEIWNAIIHVETEIHLHWSSCTEFIDGMSRALILFIEGCLTFDLGCCSCSELQISSLIVHVCGY